MNTTIKAHIVEAQQGTEAWHQHRSKALNASELAAAMGLSAYISRADLIKQKASGIVPEVDAATQRRFDAGHQAEAMTRPFAEEIIGEELYASVFAAEVDGLLLSASLDGHTLLNELTWENKWLNAELAASLDAGVIPDQYHPQIEQGLMLTGASKCLFTASNGDKDSMRSVWYESNPELRAKIIPTWKQFAVDVAAYVPTEAAPKVIAEAAESLPAVSVRMDGAIAVISNLDLFGQHLKKFVAQIDKDPSTDQAFANCEAAVKTLKKAEDALDAAEAQALAQIDPVESMRRTVADFKDPSTDQAFANCEAAVKTLKKAEDALDAAEAQALAQIDPVESMRRTVADFKDLARTNRLMLEKIVKARKETIKAEIVAGGVAALAKHLRELNAAMPADYMPQVPADFGGCIKGLKSVDSIRNAVDTELARVKIEANDIANKIRANVAQLDAANAPMLFADIKALVLKSPEDLAAIIAQRVAAEDKRKADEREKIRAEEAARIERENAAKVEADRIAREQAEAVSAARIRDELIAKQMRQLDQAEDAAIVSIPQGVEDPLPFIHATDDGARLTLGQLNDRIAPVSITVAGLASLGFDPVEQVKASRLYRERDFPAICKAISAHVLAARVATPETV